MIENYKLRYHLKIYLCILTNMDIDKKTFELVGSFLRDICKSFPEAKSSIYRNYEDILINYETKKINDCQLLQDFLKVIQDNNDLISQRNHLFFLDDTPLIKDLSLKRVWESSISEKTRNAIWKYLETITIINISIHSNQELQKALSCLGNEEPVEIKDKKTAKDLKQLKQLSENLTQENEETTDTEGSNGIEDLMGGLMNSNIGTIAKEVAESSEIQSLFGNMDQNANPMEMMQSLMSGDAMGNIFKNINTVIEKKVETGEMNQDTLQKEAEGLYGNMGQNPLFNSMMNPQKPDQPESKDDTREKLKQKIKAKSDARNKK
tara:strand:+ start:126 stop:1088 length:963 start_codon:yes stop_codon:yes gene_type:complete